MKILFVSITFVAFLGMISCGNAPIKTDTVTQNNLPVIQENEKVDVLPTFQIKSVKNELIDLRSFKGKKVFVNLWASWCGPCRGEMPAIQALFNKVKNNNVAFVLIGLDDDFEKSKSYMNENGFTLPLYYPAGQMPDLFIVPGIPTTFIFDETGNLIKKIEGGNDYDTDEFVRLLSTQ